MFCEIRVDLDFRKHDPCWLVVRLLRFLTFFTWLFPAPIIVSRTSNGLHLRALVVSPVDDGGILRTRAWLGDDFDRLALDIVRTVRSMFQKDVFFTARIKRYQKDSPYGREEEVDIRDLPQLVDELLEMCLEKVQRRKLRRLCP